MQETSKTGRRTLADHSAAAAKPPTHDGSSATSDATDPVLRSLAQQIGRDASDDPVTYLLRSNTAHDGE